LSCGLGAVSALGGQRGQAAPGQVAIDPDVQAREPLRPFESENAPPARLGFIWLATLAVGQCLPKQQLGVVGLE
jgi:hypothetical protein